MMGERLPETCRVVIPIKLEFSASVGFIHKEKILLLLFSVSFVKLGFARLIVDMLNFILYIGVVMSYNILTHLYISEVYSDFALR